MNLIVACDKNWAIGKDNGLLVHLPEDLKYYKEKTIGKVIVVGRKTLESFPGGRPLPNRINIVLTANPDYKNEHCIVCCGKDALYSELQKYDNGEIFVSGGSMTYELLFDSCDVIYVTKIFSEFEADKYFKNMEEQADFEITWQSDIKEHDGTQFQFLKYERKSRKLNERAGI